MKKGAGGWIDFDGIYLVYKKEAVVGPARVIGHRSKDFHKRCDMRKERWWRSNPRCQKSDSNVSGRATYHV